MKSVEISIPTPSQISFIDVTKKVSDVVMAHGLTEGLCHLYVPHTTSGITINEHADPAVKDDIIAALQKMLPKNITYSHLEGNSPAHIMSSLVGSSVTIGVLSGKLRLGTWQGIFFCEFDGPRNRKLIINMLAG